MLVFRYDKSFDGLLSALFDAYSLRAFPEALIGPGEPEPLFTERVHEVATDGAHADRVWRGLERRLTARIRSMFVYAWHGEQPQGDLLMLRCLRRVFDEGGGVVADQADPDMKSLFQLALKVSTSGNASNSSSGSRRLPTAPILPPPLPNTTPCRCRWITLRTVSPTSGGLSTTGGAITDIITTGGRRAGSRWRTTAA